MKKTHVRTMTRVARRNFAKRNVKEQLLRQATNPDLFDVNFKSRRGKLARVVHMLWHRLKKDPRLAHVGNKYQLINQYEIARAYRHAIADAARASLG